MPGVAWNHIMVIYQDLVVTEWRTNKMSYYCWRCDQKCERPLVNYMELEAHIKEAHKLVKNPDTGRYVKIKED